MALHVGLNGAGRIGRALLRILRGRDDVRISAINELAHLDMLEHLLRHDSVHGPFPGEIASGPGSLILEGRPIAYSQIPDPAAIPWESAGVEVVVEATGAFSGNGGARQHLERTGVQRVLVSAVSMSADTTLILGVHSGSVEEGQKVISTGSCTTHAAALPLAVLDERYGVVAAEMSTVHCTTGSQRTMDLPHRDPRRARSALLSMIPTTTSASRGLVAAIPQLEGRLSCLSIRVPVATVSLVDLVVQTERPVTSREEVQALFEEAATRSLLAGRLGVSDEPLVSIDFKGDARTSIVDLPLVERPGAHLVRIIAWYDNEWGYASRIADLLGIWAQERS